jgi:hypothetical protein
MHQFITYYWSSVGLGVHYCPRDQVFPMHIFAINFIRYRHGLGLISLPLKPWRLATFFMPTVTQVLWLCPVLTKNFTWTFIGPTARLYSGLTVGKTDIKFNVIEFQPNVYWLSNYIFPSLKLTEINISIIQWKLSMLATYGATKNRPTYTGGQLTENHIFYMTTYIHLYNNYPNRIIILRTSTDHLWFTMFYVLF